MAGRRTWAPHGTVRRYRQGGCDELIGGTQGVGERCLDCKAAMRDRDQQKRAGDATFKTDLANVRTIDGGRLKSIKGGKSSTSAPAQSNTAPNSSNPGPTTMGRTERAVATQFAEMIAKGENLVLIEGLFSAARILDNEQRASLHPTTLRQLDAIVGKLTEKKKTKTGGRLAKVRYMSGGARKSG